MKLVLEWIAFIVVLMGIEILMGARNTDALAILNISLSVAYMGWRHG